MAQDSKSYTKFSDEADDITHTPISSPDYYKTVVHTEPKKLYDPEEIEKKLLTARADQAEWICQPFLETEGHACYCLGNYYYYRNDSDKAHTYYKMGRLKYNKCLKRIAEQFQKGMQYAKDESEKEIHRTQAINYYLEYLAKEKDSDCYMQVANLYFESKKIDEAIEYYEKYLAMINFSEQKEYPKTSSIVTVVKNLGSSYEMKSLREKALEFYVSVYKKGLSHVLKDICELCLDSPSENKIEAEIFNYFKEAVEKNYLDAKYMMAHIFWKMKSFGKAKEFFKIAEREYRDARDFEKVRYCQTFLAHIVLSMED
ncbi:MAG: hypothetical protein Harvfovirus5_21 [Harvfovirus sp.]|uniref:Uncharacterized protein n=1 Tax=Harvfovirus sp. TaxID=2487768 RepID=A0A3G5A0K4_9VIRU|nr:MAG: hypothetical protein Harvfovirus5_21 [Harvfovirus sp.]